jgi:hypothetical protein
MPDPTGGVPAPTTPAPTTPAPTTPASVAGRDTAARIWDAFQVVTAIGSPIAVGAALLFYFGWSRSQAQAKAFGADVSVFDMSPNELALRSIDAVFFPSLLLVLAALAGLALHRALLRGLSPPPWLDRLPLPRWARPTRSVLTRRLAWLLDRTWLVLLPMAALLLAVDDDAGRLVLPFLIGLAIFSRIYGTLLRRRVTGDTTRTSRPILVLVAALCTITLFWQTERIATIVGQATAQDIKDRPGARLHLATVYSAHRLYIAAPNVTETLLPEPGDSYRYQYCGLYLLQRSGGKYFFITGGWDTGQGRLVVVPDNDSVRLDFSQVAGCPAADAARPAAPK